MQDIKDEATINSLLSHRKIRFNIYPNKEVGSAEFFFTMSTKPARKTMQAGKSLQYKKITIKLSRNESFSSFI